ncbi:MAG: phosphoribosylaminoimidazolesuccinocarboxamide synthase [Pseudomonadota bacterium]
MNPTAPGVLYETHLPHLKLLHRGKVRDVYDAGENRLLMVACDRLSAFDVVLPTAIPGKGALLTELSNFWFARTASVIRNHLLPDTVANVTGPQPNLAALERRGVVVKKLQALPVEAIVRGYVAGSGWTDYQRTGAICGHELPPGLAQAEQLPAPIFTPSTKAAVGAHDENISRDAAADLIGKERAEEMEQVSLKLYSEARSYANHRGIIIADTKFEFGIDNDDQLVLMDEILTPDSSRFWPADQYQTGISPPSFDKQFVRDYLETLDWDKTAPGPELPAEIAKVTAQKYEEALKRLTAD